MEKDIEKQLFFPFAGEIQVSPEVFDFFNKSTKGLHKRISDLLDTIAEMENKLISNQEKFDRRIRELEKPNKNHKK
jgi:peptidoglycan hydrolase CwlO-like protein